MNHRDNNDSISWWDWKRRYMGLKKNFMKMANQCRRSAKDKRVLISAFLSLSIFWHQSPIAVIDTYKCYRLQVLLVLHQLWLGLLLLLGP